MFNLFRQRAVNEPDSRKLKAMDHLYDIDIMIHSMRLAVTSNSICEDDSTSLLSMIQNIQNECNCLRGTISGSEGGTRKI